MAKTVVGLFRSAAEAENIKRELAVEGVQPENIRVVANEGSVGNTSDRTEADSGVIASIKRFFQSLTGGENADHEYYSQAVSRGGALLAATVPDNQADAVAGLLEQYGASNVNDDVGAAAANTSQGTRAAAAGATAIPVVEEELQVGKRAVRGGGVRVYSQVVETPVEEDVKLREEHVRVQRNPVNRPASEADFQAFKEGSIELAETREEAVVSKRARVVEEVTIAKDVTERTEKVKDTLRHTEVEIEELSGGERGKTSSAGK